MTATADSTSRPTVFPARPPARPFAIALLALVLGALLTLLALLGYLLGYYLVLESHGREETISFGADRLRLVLGTGEQRGEGIVITGLDPERGYAQIGSVVQPLPAAQLGELGWWIEGLGAEDAIDLLWMDPSRQLHRLPLEHGGQSRGRLALANSPGWQGTITGIGLLLNSPLATPVIVRELQLRPVRLEPLDLLHHLWHQWTVVEGWQSYSINLIQGGAGALIGPTPFAALWMVLSLISHVLLRGWVPLGLIVLAVWLVLDLRWQWNLGRQLEVSLEQLVNKDAVERLRNYDDELIDLISAVKQRLPSDPVRIFLVSNFNDAAGSARHGRVRYHLTPHNVYGFSARPPLARWTRSGDYLLALLPLQDIGYRRIPGNEALLWDDNELPVELLLAEHEGLLFRIGAVP